MADFFARTDLTECIDELHAADGGKLIKEILLNAALATPEIAATLRSRKQEHIERIERERSKVIDFSSYAQKVDYWINERYMNSSCAKQYNAAFDVIRQIEEIFTTIVDQAAQKHATFGTKQSALDALYLIGWAICESQEEIGKQIRMHFQVDNSLEDSMNAVIDEMSVEECERMRAREYSGGTSFLGAMEELKKLADDYCVCTGLQGVITNLTCEDETDEDGEGEEEA